MARETTGNPKSDIHFASRTRMCVRRRMDEPLYQVYQPQVYASQPDLYAAQPQV